MHFTFFVSMRELISVRDNFFWGSNISAFGWLFTYCVLNNNPTLEIPVELLGLSSNKTCNLTYVAPSLSDFGSKVLLV